MSAESSVQPGPSSYVLGHADIEVERLLLQGRLYNHHTENALRLAGLRPGMRVLDVGCGPGEVSFVAARLVGPNGSVLGIDASADIIEMARARAAAQDLRHVSFQAIPIAEVVLDEPVDAVIGRLILMHLPDPASALRQLAGLVRPGGLIAFGESNVGAARSFPDTALSHALIDGIAQAFQALGLDPTFGTTLYGLFLSAGLPLPRLTLAAPIGGATDTDVLAYGVEVWRLVYPVAQQLGLVTDELADIDGLAERIRQDAAAAHAIVMLPPLITAWSHLPDEATAP